MFILCFNFILKLLAPSKQKDLILNNKFRTKTIFASLNQPTALYWFLQR